MLAQPERFVLHEFSGDESSGLVFDTLNSETHLIDLACFEFLARLRNSSATLGELTEHLRPMFDGDEVSLAAYTLQRIQGMHRLGLIQTDWT